MTSVENDAHDLVIRSRFYESLSLQNTPALRRITSRDCKIALLAATFPDWLEFGYETFAQLTRGARFVAASLSSGCDFREKISLRDALMLVAQSGQRGEFPVNDGMKRRGTRWAIEAWQAITASDDDPAVQETLDRFRFSKIPPIRATDLFRVMLASDEQRCRFLIDDLTKSVARPSSAR